ncbi:uncharacterized protein LOC116619488 isoform X2 [Nematostella vectensis]|uniref:uncharacterized protein LOC116619488 isoform X2 n=1 Tax=Nematostella vectensis TaxID=45351 RepID=UPI002076EA20|nr:uncharacterized protein LOC116619488 isoform X2 [Nematostella vectensis]
MADKKHFLDQLTKLHLKIIEQKLSNERDAATAQYSGSNFGRLPLGSALLPTTGFVDSDFGAQQLLQTELMKTEMLLERSKDERRAKYKTQGQPSNAENYAMEMASLMMTQNAQLQHLLLSQMRNSTDPQSEGAPRRNKDNPVSVRLLEIQPVSTREMTPFTMLPNTKKELPRPPPPLRPKPQAVRIPSPQVSHPRGIATPPRPTERLPEVQHQPKTAQRDRTQPQLEGFLNQPSIHDPSENSYPYPGPPRVRKLRHVFYAAWFCLILISLLRRLANRRLKAMVKLDENIQLAIVEIHRRYYLNQDNAIWSSLYDAIKEGCFDLNVKSPGLFGKLSQEQQAILSELASIIETIVYNITEIKEGRSGILSVGRDGVLWNMSKRGMVLPSNYFWGVEKDHIHLTASGELGDIDQQSCVMLVLGLFVSRGLVSTILLQPMDSGLCPMPPSKVAKSNLKVLGSLIMKIVRDVSTGKNKKAMALAPEISSELYSDNEMKFLYKKLDSTFIWSKANLLKWAEAFVDDLNKS